MQQIRTILCAVDFSDDSRRALRIAFGLAHRFSSSLVVLHVVDFLLAQAAAAAYSEAQLRADARRELEGVVSEERRQAHADAPEPEIAVTVGPPERRICEYAQECAADLVVMGSQGLGGLRKAFMGSVAEKVLRGSEVPVLTVRASDDGEPWFDAVFAAVGLDDAAGHVARSAAWLAERLQLPLTLVHVVTPLTAFPQYTNALETAEASRRQDAEHRLSALAAALPSRRPIGTVVRTGRPADEIAAAAAGSRPLLVIGMGGRRLLHRPGSTAYRVFSIAEVPVLAIPESGEMRK
jgi:nucleotide-binding universal stress UspA family protein